MPFLYLSGNYFGAWLNTNFSDAPIFDESVIVRDSIKNFTKTKPKDLFNDFRISYAYNPGADKFDKVLFVTNADKQTFPVMDELEGGAEIELRKDFKAEAKNSGDSVIITLTIGNFEERRSIIDSGVNVGSLVSFTALGGSDETHKVPGISAFRGRVSSRGINYKGELILEVESKDRYQPDPGSEPVQRGILFHYGLSYDEELHLAPRVWTSYVGGLSFNADTEERAYSFARSLWKLCRQSYLITRKKQQAPDSLTTLKWYYDYNDDTFSNGAVRFLHNLIEWTTRPKAQVEFTIPLNGSINLPEDTKRTLEIELLEPVYFKDMVFTHNEKRRGYVT
ncbi:hypothetical protein QA601_18955, partial [Chitinispirillales bacterium ANBcel5]|uniref:hypothetical protein n=1 Tax=Cellulosispirillum alkaliphilum TaxID=3039283 RepID=UPI002A57172E|nr:hypothetical protein [Chitinispirillales bacterium ANBcel5]